MLEIICKILFFLSMLAVYSYVTSTSKVILIVVGYIACVFSYYYFNVIQSAFDKFLNYVNFNSKFSNNITPSQVSGYFMSKKYTKIGTSMPCKKLFSYCTQEPTFSKEPILENNELPSPILKSNSPSRNRPRRDKLKLNVPDSPVLRYRNGFHHCNPLTSKRYNTNLDLETFMNVNSPGFTSRVVDKAVESASYHIKYPAVRQISTYRFDKSTLRHLSKMPRSNSTPVVRIAPPEPSGMNFLNDDGHRDRCNDEVKNNNFLQVLKDISRKRNYIQEGADRSGSNPKKSRKNDVKNFMTSQQKRSHEDSNDSLEDKSKKRCDDYDRDVAKMMVYTSSMSVITPDFVYCKKRKSSKIDKSTTESPEQNEKYRKIGKEKLETDVKKKPISNEQTKNSVTVEAEINTQSKEVDEVDFLPKEKNKFDDIPPPSDDGEYIRVANGKLLNRTNCTYRKKLNSSKIDPISVIATEPELVNGTSEVDDNLMKENLLKTLIDDIERNGDRNEDVIFYQNSIVEEIANNENKKKTGTPSLTSDPVLPTKKVEVDTISSFSPAKNVTVGTSTVDSDNLNSNDHHLVDVVSNSDEISEVVSNRKNGLPIIENKEIIHSEPPSSISFNERTSTFALGGNTNSNPLIVSSSSQIDDKKNAPSPIPPAASASTLTFGSSTFQFNPAQSNQKSVFTSCSNELPKSNDVFSTNQTNCFIKENKSESITANEINAFGLTPISSASNAVYPPANTFTNPSPTSAPNFQCEQTSANAVTNFNFGASDNGFKFNTATTTLPTFESSTSVFNVSSSSSTFNAATPSFSSSQSAFSSNLKFSSENPTFSSTVSSFNPSTTASSFSTNVPSFSASNSNFEMNNGFGSGTQSQNSFGQSNLFASNQTASFGTDNASVFGQSQFGAGGTQNQLFNFGANSTPSFNSTVAPASFGGGNPALPCFNNNSTFNFNNGSSSFGDNTFGAMAPKPTENSFSFGAGGVTSAQSTFQFGTAASSGQPFAFGAGSGGAPAVGFSIGAGGSTRNRSTRNRRNK